ncbi:hypothetical protein LINPERPRIM_LOCUS40754 [Linum perenne]
MTRNHVGFARAAGNGSLLEDFQHIDGDLYGRCATCCLDNGSREG